MASLCMQRPDPGFYAALGLTASDVVIGISHLLHGEPLTDSDHYAMARLALLLDLPEDSIGLATGLDGSDWEEQRALQEVLGERWSGGKIAQRYVAVLKQVREVPDLPLSAADRKTLERLSDFAASLSEAMLSRTSYRFLP